MTDGLKDAHREAIIATIAATDRVERAVLFGSRATGTNTVSSDVDIALFGDRLTLTDQARLAAALDEIPMAQSVDLLLHDSIQDWTLREHIRRQGVEWYARSSETWAASPARHRSTDEEWKCVALGNLAEIFDGPHATPTKTLTGPLFLGISNLASGRLDLTAAEHLSEDDYRRWTRRVTPTTNDVVFSYETRIGEAALVPKGLRACLGRRMGLLRAKDGTVDPRFLLYAFLGTQFQETLRARTVHGSTVDRIPLIEMPGFPIRVPRNVAEQRAIAHVLGTLDDKIELNRRMNATLEALARALFRSWFVDFDPVRAKMEGRDTGLPKEIADLFPNRLVDSEVGEIPRGWDIGYLSEHFEAIKGVSYKGSGLGRGGMPLHNLNSVDKRGGYRCEGIKFYSGDYADRHVVYPGDVIVANTDLGRENLLIGYSAIVPGLFGDSGIVSHHLYRVRARPSGRLSAVFLYRLLNSPQMHDVVAGYANGTTVTMLPKDALQMPAVVEPPSTLLETFDAVALDLEHRREQAVVESRTLGALRDALLPKLVSGEFQVTGLEPASVREDRPASAGTRRA